ncbi:hypothetical protein Tco_0424538 [Tanacetum coccineum]
MAEDGKLKIDSIMVMILGSGRCRSKTICIRRSFMSLWQKPNLQRTDTGVEGTTEGKEQNRNKSKSWKIGEIKDKEVNMAAGDYDDALVRGDGIAIIKRRLQDIHRDAVRDLVTASGHGRLKEDLKSSTWRWRTDI